MRILFASTVLALTTPALAQEPASGPYKLVITWFQNDIVVIDYPSLARCERAQAAVIRSILDRNRRAAEAGAVRMPSVSAEIAFCIPG